MKNRSGVARALIDSRESTIWLQAAAKERMSICDKFCWFSASGSLGSGICSYFGGKFFFFLVGGVTYVLPDSPISLPDLTQI